MECLKTYLHTLCDLDGISNFEDAVRDWLIKQGNILAQEVFVDRVGNVYVFKKGAAVPNRPILVLAHMDEPGFLVKEITSDGYLHIESIDNCVDPRSMLGKKLWIGKNRIPGVIGLKAIHLTPKSARSDIPPLSSLSVDIGAAGKEAAEKLVKVGDIAVPAYALVEMGDCFRGKGLLYRSGCAVAMRLLEDELTWDTWFVFIKKTLITPYFGGEMVAQRIQPGFSVLLEGCHANDMPNIDKERRIVNLRGGAAVALKAGSGVYSRDVIRNMTTWADCEQIPWQYIRTERIRDAGNAMIFNGGGGKAISLSVPVRYANTCCPVICKNDIGAVYHMASYVLTKAGVCDE